MMSTTILSRHFFNIIMSHCGGTFASYVTFVKQHSLSRCWCLAPHQQYFFYVDLVNCLAVGNRNPHIKSRTYCMELTQTVFNHTNSTVRYEVNHHTIKAFFLWILMSHYGGLIWFNLIWFIGYRVVSPRIPFAPWVVSPLFPFAPGRFALIY